MVYLDKLALLADLDPWDKLEVQAELVHLVVLAAPVHGENVDLWDRLVERVVQVNWDQEGLLVCKALERWVFRDKWEKEVNPGQLELQDRLD